MDKLNPFQIERKRERGREEKQCDKKILNFVWSLRKKSYNWWYIGCIFFNKTKCCWHFNLPWPNGEMLVNISKVNISKFPARFHNQCLLLRCTWQLSLWTKMLTFYPKYLSKFDTILSLNFKAPGCWTRGQTIYRFLNIDSQSPVGRLL